jgi:hypothetical protein
MAQPERQIIQDFTQYFNNCGGGFASWFVGTCSNPTTTLFNRHKVNKQKDRWIMAYAKDPDVARRIKLHFMQTLGADGSLEDSDEGGRGVYAYMKSWRTDPAEADMDKVRIT